MKNKFYSKPEIVPALNTKFWCQNFKIAPFLKHAIYAIYAAGT